MRNKAITIVTVALMLTILIGCVANVDHVTKTTTTYDDRTDLDPLFYANSSRSTSTELYNSPYNVTGWFGNVTVPTSSTPNSYIQTSQYTNYTSSTISAFTSGFSGLTLTNGSVAAPSQYVGGKISFSTTTSGVYLVANDLPTYSNGAAIMGGIGVNSTDKVYGTTSQYRVVYQFNSSDIGVSLYTILVPISTYFSPTDGQRITAVSAAGGTGLYGGISVAKSYQSPDPDSSANSSIRVTVNFTGTQISLGSGYIQYDAATETWKQYANDALVASYSNIYVGCVGSEVGQDSYKMDLTIDTPTIVPSTYADPMALVTLSTTPPNKWSNFTMNNSMVNTAVSFYITGVSSECLIWVDSTTNPNLMPVINAFRIGMDLINGLYTWTLGWGEAWTSMTTVSVGSYPQGIIVTVTPSGVTAEGVLSWTSPYEYTTSGIKAHLDTHYPNTTDITALWFWPRDATTQARVLDTYIQTDAQGVLWADPMINLKAYFPETDNMRVSINGVVAVGDTITIAGTSYQVHDGSYIQVPTAGSTKIPLSGLSIDWLDGHVYINSGTRTYDLGESTDYTLGGTGSWYFAGYEYAINTTEAQALDWRFGWDMDMNAALLLFLGMLILVGGVVSYYVRGGFSAIDWVVLIMAGVMAYLLLS